MIAHHTAVIASKTKEKMKFKPVWRLGSKHLRPLRGVDGERQTLIKSSSAARDIYL